MTLTSLQRRNQSRTERLRGWIVNILYNARPDPCEFAVLSATLDGYGFGCSRRTLAMEVDFLRSLKLVRVFPLGADEELDKIAQAKLLQRYANSDNDQEIHLTLCSSLTAHGINFQEGLEHTIEGIQHVR
jgi:hypothetical protein